MCCRNTKIHERGQIIIKIIDNKFQLKNLNSNSNSNEEQNLEKKKFQFTQTQGQRVFFHQIFLKKKP